MSGDWLKMEATLPEKPEVWQIAGMVGIDPDAVVGKLFKVWRWFDAHTETGNAVGVTYALVDHVSGVTGFGEAMALCGWLLQDGSILSVPNFERHNGKTAKNRALTAKRVATFKEKGNAKGNDDSVTSALPREEKRREEEKSKEAREAPVAKPEEREQPKAPKQEPKFNLPDWITPEAWNGFEEMRNRKRQPMTNRARGMIVAELIKLRDAGNEPNAVLDQSTRNGWQDVYALKDKGPVRPVLAEKTGSPASRRAL